MVYKRTKSPGVTLIMVAGVLAVLAALGAGFYTITISQQKSASRYTDAVRAELMAKAGIQDAIARLRENAFQKIEDPSDRWYTMDWLHGASKRISFPALDHKQRNQSGGPLEKSFSRALQNSTGDFGSDNYTLEISDASSRINVNACDNLGVLLDNLCRVIGAPLVAADLDQLQPAVWGTYGAAGYSLNKDDTKNQGACYYMPTKSDKLLIDLGKNPIVGKDGQSARYGDGYSIARYRAVNGRFAQLTDVKYALTVVSQPKHPELEQLERELKFLAIKDYITIDSYVDTNTVCVGKFEWVNGNVAIDRDKSWIEDDPIKDPKNHRGSLRGSYLAILTGQAAGTLRRIKTNGVDWVETDIGFTAASGGSNKPIAPGPISTYMIIAKEDAYTETIAKNVDVPKQDSATGILVDDPDIDYQRYPLCIHRAPVNINTASDKVLTAMFMGIDVSHGHYMAVGTDVDVDKTKAAWFKEDPHKVETQINTLAGLRRVPQSTGKIFYDKPLNTIIPTPLPSGYNIGYINNYGDSSPTGNVTEAHDLAMRIILARQLVVDPKTGLAKPQADPYNTINNKNKHGYRYSYLTGPLKSWDDFYFRIVQPWDTLRFELDDKRGHAAQMIMAHFNSNTDILKFNPGIEWIDRWGRNFTEMEPVFGRDPGGTPVWAAGYDAQYGVNYAQYVIRNMRYKADEMIDKTDLNRSTTEFCFDSGGIFQIRSTGRIMKNGGVVAERQVETLVQLYDVWRETTQRQFVQGTISEAATPTAIDGPLSDFSHSGKPVRDGKNHQGRRLALDTYPEPLVPLNYVLNHDGRNADVVDTQAPGGRDCYGNPKSAGKGNGASQPDVVTNKVQPASYDGQILLATNTSRYGVNNEEKNTFLASFNGDLDTDTSVGNGREQAKSPGDRTTRVLDTCGLLGVLGDNDPKHIDYDMQDGITAPYNTYRISAMSGGLRPLNANEFSDGITLRQGDLRPEGVWLGFTGVSGNEGTLKYLIDISGGQVDSAKRKNLNPEDGSGAQNGCTICMWFKSAWAGDDNRYHEFFNADNPGDGANARYMSIVKGSGFPGESSSNSLTSSFEDQWDNDFDAALYGGVAPDPVHPKDSKPAFRVQPFRWGFLGASFKYNYLIASVAGQEYQSGVNSRNTEYLTKMNRVFINTQLDPEGSKWSAKWFSSRDGNQGHGFAADHCDIGASRRTDKPPAPFKNWNQEAAWAWADGGSKTNPAANASVFGMNNLCGSPLLWIYRDNPIDGTCSVVDEFKISKSMWDTDLTARVMAVSRYYLPAHPASRSECPTFTSQSLLQSLNGVDPGKTSLQFTRPIRIAWTCFTPRFMHDRIPSLANPGPFDYMKYNAGLYSGDDHPFVPAKDGSPTGVYRPTLLDYQAKGVKQSFAVSGIEVDLLNDATPIAGESEETPGKFVAKGNSADNPFTDPNVLNRFPDNGKLYPTDKLHYRVRFRYPIDPYFGGGTVDPSTQTLLDSPVFDDISISFTIPVRTYYYREISE